MTDMVETTQADVFGSNRHMYWHNMIPQGQVGLNAWSLDQLSWLVENFGVSSIEIAYMQSRKIILPQMYLHLILLGKPFV